MSAFTRRPFAALSIIAASVALAACTESEGTAGDVAQVEGLSNATGNLVAEGASS
ncbi:hypothetical protein [Corynebacterium argentoratense]|uniref:hypothetical protein n=1 Tax=Corynebacterium argentoratense TaxID=42817 RepID=UPI001F44CD67|nr:hypothetical protein [Corynebacterium argentoratense]MCF1766290.1 hypothetical protein [Corynebacterium argentoratense]